MKERVDKIKNIIPPRFTYCAVIGMFLSGAGLALVYVGMLLMLSDLHGDPTSFLVAGIRGAEAIRLVSLA